MRFLFYFVLICIGVEVEKGFDFEGMGDFCGVCSEARGDESAPRLVAVL